ncbi:MAG: AAC(3) family N-acetyltransferase [Acidobacteria bacterium]|nr:AAC(3) family N-acetyltransferase [Candidatus Sulfomarinibacter kjeldsenii]
MSAMLNRADLARDLRRLGLRAGDWVLVHSSLKMVGYVDGGADTVVDALLGVLGDDGMLVVPTFTFTNFKPVFDPETTPSQMGALTEAVRQRPHVVRSLHPRHSFGALGKQATWLTDGHLEAGSVGLGSPIDKLAQRGGYVLLLGVGHTTNTAIHAAELLADLPYLCEVKDSPDFPEHALVKLASGKQVRVSLAPYSTCSEGFDQLEAAMERRGQLRCGRVGAAECQLMECADVVATGTEVLRRDPDALLCDRSGCFPCDEKREFMRRRRSVATSSNEASRRRPLEITRP